MDKDKKDKNSEDKYIIPLNVGNPKRYPAKLTAPKRKIVLESLSEEWNVSLAASKIGCSRQAIEQLTERDPVFQKAYERVEQAYLDRIEGISVTMACEASRDGFPDRKLQLQSRRRDIYGQKPDTAIQVNIASENAHIELKNLLDKPVTKPINAEFTVIGEEQST